ncbi:RES family NAD+ phosphorylase [Gordonia aichiensis]|uniref:RES family NAD+ phosphorylase n=1 Tax=Gordonia aichiensis TaxID=36820 RepID=UPI0032631FCC
MTEHLSPPDTSRFPDLDDQYVRTLDTTVTIGRIYFAGGPYPGMWDQFRSFGPTKSRFDHHQAPPTVHADRAIMYLAPALADARGRLTSSLETALVECFRDTGTVDARTDLPYFVTFTHTRPLRLLDVADSDWITTAGGNAAISSGTRDIARQWSTAIYEHYPADDIDGLVYTSSNMPANRAIALYERGADALPDRPTFNEPLDHIGLRPAIEQFAYRVGLSLIT